MLGELAFHVRRHQHVRDRDPRSGDEATGVQRGQRCDHPQQDPEDQQDQRHPDRPLQADPPGEPGRDRREEPETQQWQRGEQTGKRCGQASVLADGVQQRRHRNNRRSEVQGNRDRRDGSQQRDRPRTHSSHLDRLY